MDLTTRLIAERPLLLAAFGRVEIDHDKSLVIVDSYRLGSAWTPTESPLLIEVPASYPTTPPDNICLASDVRLSNGVTPSNTMGVREIAGRRWLQFSYHIESADWMPRAELSESHTLVTYLQGAVRRFEEPD